MRPIEVPKNQGLYHSDNEHDACGVGFIVDIKNRPSRKIVDRGLKILNNLTHRGAVGADPEAGDGCGILIQIPHKYFIEVCDFELPPQGQYAVGTIFLPQNVKARNFCLDRLAKLIDDEGQIYLGCRVPPTDNSALGYSIIDSEPVMLQVFIAPNEALKDRAAFERKLFVIRKQLDLAIHESGVKGATAFYMSSLSTRTIIYKGLFLPARLSEYYQDLQDKRVISAIALVHQRFATNTFPTWNLVHPFRMVAHNGEINTVRGNVNWMNARKHSMRSTLFGDDIKKIWPLTRDGQSDTSCFDNALELLTVGGYSLGHAMMMLIPEAWGNNKAMDPKLRAFYEYHAALMEPWDGPAAVAFTDGKQIGATLDRNGLRPARYFITKDDQVIMASEMGVLPIPEKDIVKKWRLQPGKMLLIDLQQGRIIDDAELKKELADGKPYQQYLDKTQFHLEDLDIEVTAKDLPEGSLLQNQQAFGYTQEDVKFLLVPMAESGKEAIGSMGTDVPPAVLSDHSKPIGHYFKQNFAQVTNPPIDPIREEIVMSLMTLIGPRPNLLGLDGEDTDMRLEINQPILSISNLGKVKAVEESTKGAFKTKTLSMLYPASKGSKGLEPALKTICDAAVKAVHDGYNILILSDRGVDETLIPIPALLATSAVHHHLIRKGLRTETGLVLETGAAKEVHDFATLAGYGAEAINPYLAIETICAHREEIDPKISEGDLVRRYIKAIGKGLLKVMSKMGISTYQSYCGAQIFDAVGLSSDFIDQYFTGTSTNIEGIGLKEIATESVRWHKNAYGDNPIYQKHLDVGGDYAFRQRGESHTWNPQTIAKLQHATRANNAETYKEFADLINKQNEELYTFRGLFELKFNKKAVPLDQVESAENIVKRFSTGAMSFGSISYEAHSNLAIAMNEIGGKSNTGEGGELRERFAPLEDGSMNPKRSAIKQVASGRFGVTTEYLVNSDVMQIKMAQGAKPGEGGQLPGHKVDETIANVRHSTAGVGLISPPPHHDIYSIEDLAQLIHDLKNTNPKADVSVKLVSEVGVGTVAAGVAKAHADHITIAGYDGGTGASPLTSIKHAGSPWEMGLAETHQTLLLNQLRGRVAVQVDGGLRTGRDVVVGALLGADEFGFATAPLIVSGCIMMRKCHLNTCPVGIATQNPELRKRFTGQPGHVINYFFMVAEEIRELMAKLGYRNFNDMIGQAQRLEKRRALKHWKAKGLDFSRVFHVPKVAIDEPVFHSEVQDHGLSKAADKKLIKLAKQALETRKPVKIEVPIKNVNRCFGTMLSGEVARRFGMVGLPDDTIHIKATGTSGQSLGAWLAQGVTLEIVGEGNDYVGKGLSGGRIVIYPQADCGIEKAEENIIAGNTLLYGAITGECYLRGVVGERFAVRNSGAIAVVEGTGDHGCEYMTGGIVVVLGETGRNFAAGMSGGIAYVYDVNGDFASRCNGNDIDLEKIKREKPQRQFNVKDDLMANDEQRLRTLIEQHKHYTNSAVARRMLKNWDETIGHFVKVVPTEFRAALNKQQNTTADNRSKGDSNG